MYALMSFFFMESDILGVILDTWVKISGVMPLSNADNNPIIPKPKKSNTTNARKTAKNNPIYIPIRAEIAVFDQRYKFGSMFFDKVSKNKTAVNIGAIIAAIIANHLKIFLVDIIPLLE